MCQQVYLGSTKMLPEITWNDSQPQFYIKVADSNESTQRIQQLLVTPYVYSIGSFMGCTCGLICDCSFKQQEPETYEQRLQDIFLLKNYLTVHEWQNSLKIFVTSWDKFPDVYPQAFLSLNEINAADFDLPEDVVLTVTS